MKFPILESERLHLTHITKKDALNLYDIFSRDDVIRYYGMDHLKSVDQAGNMVEAFQSAYENKRAIRWAIRLKGSNECIGTLGLNNLNNHGKKAEIGYDLHPNYWGKGITSEAVKKVLAYSFNELQLYRMGAVTYPQNKASIQLLERLGFKHEGVLRGYLFQNNQSHDANVYSLLKPEWVETSKGLN
ncbi:GNAT family N-acetyltransferase [Bacillaceae bacterium W0354]